MSGNGTTPNERLLLKWGTLKGYHYETEETKAALQAYFDEPVSVGCATQRDTETQKQALCKVIDVVAGPITNDWTGEDMTKDEAKEYVLSYGREATNA